MSARLPLATAWTALAVTPLALVVGHGGKHELSWVNHQVSTFAARGPNDAWVTAGMLLAALGLLSLGVSIPLRRPAGASLPEQLLAAASGGAAGGLVLLASFEEAAPTLQQVQRLGADAIRQQAFHDAGLLLFFYGASLLFALAGLLVALQGPGWARRSVGALVACAGPVATVALTTAWPRLIGITSAASGLRQRSAFLCLWVAALLLLRLVQEAPLVPRKGD